MNDEIPRRPVFDYFLYCMAALTLLGVFVMLDLMRRDANVRAHWHLESFSISCDSGGYASVYIFVEPRIVIFLGEDRGFNNVTSRGYQTFSLGSGNGSHGTLFVYDGDKKWTHMEFLDGKCGMKIDHKGTKLILADGREFSLVGNEPIWLRCKDDGTITELDALPEGFLEFMERPITQPMDFRADIESYPAAFQRSR